MPELLNEEVKVQVRQVFEQLEKPVKVFFFGREEGCDYCDDTRQLVEEITALSDRLDVEVYDIDADEEVARGFKVDKTPGLVIAGMDGDRIIDYGIRFSGIPSGHEFTSLIHDLVMVSRRDSGLSESTRAFLNQIDKPVHLQVFVTPT
jgi:glutaredoxin-like protein